MRRAIDGVCDIYDASPTLVRHVRLARIRDASGAGAWKASSDAGLAKLQSGGGSLDAEFADVFSRDGKIVYAIDTRGDAREYCYINGKLARASTRFVDASSDRSISRNLYFTSRGSLFADTGSVEQDIGEEHRTIAEPRPPALTIDVYPTPKTLPFFAAYRSALAGRLPAL